MAVSKELCSVNTFVSTAAVTVLSSVGLRFWIRWGPFLASTGCSRTAKALSRPSTTLRLGYSPSTLKHWYLASPGIRFQSLLVLYHPESDDPQIHLMTMTGPRCRFRFQICNKFESRTFGHWSNKLQMSSNSSVTLSQNTCWSLKCLPRPWIRLQHSGNPRQCFAVCKRAVLL